MARFIANTTAGVPVNRSARTSTDSNQLIIIGEAITVTAAQLTLNALFGNIKVPKNAEVAWVMLGSDQIDSNGSPLATLSIGDVGADSRLLAASTVGQAGTLIIGPTIAKAGFGFQYTAETLVQVKLKVAPATAVGGVIKYVVGYVSQ